MNTGNLYQTQIINYLDQVYRSQPDPHEFIHISSHQHQIQETGTFMFPKPADDTPADDTPADATPTRTQYYLRGINISCPENILDRQTDLSVQLICGRQTWISGQLGLLDTHALKNLIIPIPAPDVPQEIELHITSTNHTEKLANSGCGWLNYDVVAAPDFQGDDLSCSRQIIYQVPDAGIIHNGIGVLGYRTNCYTRLEIYVPYEIIYEPEIMIITNLVDSGAGTHNLISQPHQQITKAGYKIYKFDMNQIAPNSMIKLHQVLPSGEFVKTQTQTLSRIKYSFIENQVVRMKNGYIGLAF